MFGVRRRRSWIGLEACNGPRTYLPAILDASEIREDMNHYAPGHVFCGQILFTQTKETP